MEWLVHLIDGSRWLLIFMLVLTRVSGLMIGTPVLGGTEVPVTARAMFAIVIAGLVAPLQFQAAATLPTTPVELLLLIGSELLVGLLLGLGTTIVLSGVQLAGHVVGQLGGLSLAEIYNPSADASLPLVSELLYLFAITVFVLIGGHRLLLVGLLDTFATLPPGGATWSQPLAETLSSLVAGSFALGVRAAAPGTVALMLVTIVLGLLSRTLPQLNIMSLGFGFNALALIGTVWVTLGALVWLLHEHFEPAIEAILEVLPGAR